MKKIDNQQNNDNRNNFLQTYLDINNVSMQEKYIYAEGSKGNLYKKAT